MDTLDDEMMTAQDGPVYQHAGFWIRVGASMLDSLILAPLGWLDGIQQITFGSKAISIAVIILTFIYKPLMEAERGATLGKILLKLKVIRTDEGRIGIREAIVRYTPWILVTLGVYALSYSYGFDLNDQKAIEEILTEDTSKLFSFLGIISLLSLFYVVSVAWVAFDDKQQGLHDKLAETYVVKVIREN